jgi:hypothetical protein
LEAATGSSSLHLNFVQLWLFLDTARLTRPFLRHRRLVFFFRKQTKKQQQQNRYKIFVKEQRTLGLEVVGAR